MKTGESIYLLPTELVITEPLEIPLFGLVSSIYQVSTQTPDIRNYCKLITFNQYVVSVGYILILLPNLCLNTQTSLPINLSH
jgi:hypothetical protein